MVPYSALVLVKEQVHASIKPVVRAVVVGPTRSIDVSAVEWDAWVLGAYKHKVVCRPVNITSISSGCSDEADLETLQPDNSPITNLAGNILSVVENLIDLEIDGYHSSCAFGLNDPQSVPVFISGDSGLRPGVARVKVSLHIKTLGDLPDVAGHIAFLRLLESGGPLPAGLAYSDLFLEAANNTIPAEGLVLPVELRHEGDMVYGVLVLNKRYAESVFDAMVFVTAALARLAPGTLLRRVLRWEERGEKFSSDVVVAEVLDEGLVSGCC